MEFHSFPHSSSHSFFHSFFNSFPRIPLFCLEFHYCNVHKWGKSPISNSAFHSFPRKSSILLGIPLFQCPQIRKEWNSTLFSGIPLFFTSGPRESIPLIFSGIPLNLMKLVEFSRISIPLRLNGSSTFLEKSSVCQLDFWLINKLP